MKKERNNLIINAIAHFFVDAVSASLVFGVAGMHLSDERFALAILLYDTIAFLPQCLIGLLTDRLGRCRLLAGVSATLMGVVWFASGIPVFGRVFLVALLNACFHVGAGSVTIEDSTGKATPLGIFVAPGAMGLTLGTFYAGSGNLYAAGLLAVSVALLICAKKFGDRLPIADQISNAGGSAYGMKIPKPKEFDAPGAGNVMILILCAVAIRAIGGTAMTFPWRTTDALAVLMTLFVLIGKGAGGILADKLPLRHIVLITIPLSAVLIAFGSGSMFCSLLGQLLLNLTMPITLWLLTRAMPASPGFAFGLAAAALWPGTIIGTLLPLTGPALRILVLICILFGVYAVLRSERILRDSDF